VAGGVDELGRTLLNSTSGSFGPGITFRGSVTSPIANLRCKSLNNIILGAFARPAITVLEALAARWSSRRVLRQ
jgi:hypothetical protein